ncbi:hypothetical protein BST61_g6372 [Cercospora zeina]
MSSQRILPSLSLKLPSLLQIKYPRDRPSRKVFVLHIRLAFGLLIVSEHDFIGIQSFSVANLAISGTAISSSIPMIAQFSGSLAAQITELFSTDACDVVAAIGQLNTLCAIWTALVVFSSYQAFERSIVLLHSATSFCGKLTVVSIPKLRAVLAAMPETCRTSQASILSTSRTQPTHGLDIRPSTQERPTLALTSRLATVDSLRHGTPLLSTPLIKPPQSMPIKHIPKVPMTQPLSPPSWWPRSPIRKRKLENPPETWRTDLFAVDILWSTEEFGGTDCAGPGWFGTARCYHHWLAAVHVHR